ncbi:hypothetical protein AYI70_g11472 [Smittium culicis]|uniref:Uncharacterized protein n=1 Tax=Smittium culicis TaxID=133412 RepID=A0A1R1X1S7_9FUNG|nr:hypothetical protein AYI70_g11472 [Smittium culicis]
MNYNPPPLNDSESTAVKKADTALYGIQVALAQATRLIDYFFHRRIKDNPGLDTSEDPEVMFASTMRALLSDVAATVTQARLDNLNKGLELPGKPTQLVEPDTKPLMDQEALDALISKKPTAKPETLLRRRAPTLQLPLKPNQATGPSTASQVFAEGFAAAEGGLNRDLEQPPSRGAPCYIQIRLRGDSEPTSRAPALLLPFQKVPEWHLLKRVALCVDPKGLHQVRRSQLPLLISHPRRYKRKLNQDASKVLTDKLASLLEKKVIDEIQPKDPVSYSQMFTVPKNTGGLRPVLDLRKLNQHVEEQNFKIEILYFICRNGPQKRLFDVPQPTGCIHAYPVSGPTIRFITEPVGFHQDSLPSFTMGQVPGNANLSIFGLPANHGRIQRGSENQDPGPSTRGQQNSECWPDDIEMSSELYWESSSNSNRSPTWSPNTSTTPGAQELLPVDIEIMDFDSETDEPSHTEPIILEEPAEIMERSLVLARDPRIGDLHGLQRLSVGDCGRTSNILRIMATIRGEDAHKRQGTDDGLVCTQAKECDRTGGVSLFGQHNHTIVRKEIRRNDFPRTAWNSRENLVTLLEDQ